MIALETSFYVTGGTLEPGARSYVERKADSDLFTRLSHGEFCYVLTPRQMGKSSLMARTAARLRQEGAAVLVLELTGLGQNLTVEQWYDGLLASIGLELDLDEELETFWLEHERLSPLQRWLRALREVVLAQHPGRVVICLDEIDVVRSLPFPTDEFFAAIRECYNRRSADPAFQRLTFCLLGVATPSDLIQDTRTTPFNIGERIELADFTAAEAAPLALGLSGVQAFGRSGVQEEAAGGPDRVNADRLLERVLYWTGGHPYLTQRLCQAVAEDPQASDAAAVDRLCAGLFLSHGARERDNNLLFVRDRVLKSEADRASLLDLYGKVWAGKRVAADETNPLVDVLRLSGIVRIAESVHPLPDTRAPTPSLVVRNRIYAHVFDRAWVAANMPDVELRRQRAAYRRGLLRASAVAALIVAVMVGLALATVNARIAREGQETLRRSLYVADMNMAQQAVREGNLERAEELLDEHRPRGVGEADVRGFEWRYLWRLCQEDALYTFHEKAGTVWSAASSPDGRLLAAVNEGAAVKLWDVATKELVTTLPTSLLSRGVSVPFAALSFSADGTKLAVLNPTSTNLYTTTTLWDVATQRRLETFASSQYGISPWISPDDKLMAAVVWSRARNPELQTLKVWDRITRQEVATLRAQGWIASIAFSPDGKTIAAAVGGNRVGLWNFAASREMALLPSHKDGVWAVAFSPDGKTLATCGVDQTVRLWDRVTRRVVATLKGSHLKELRGGASYSSYRLGALLMAFSPNGKKLATASDVTTAVTLWDLDRKEKSSLRGHKKGVRSLVFSRDSEKLATASLDGTVKLWSATPRREGTALGKLRSEPLSVAFAPDSKTLATGNEDGAVTLWSAASGPAVASLPGHRGPVQSVAFSPDGKLLASGGSDRTVRLWRVASRRQVVALTGHKDEVQCVAFSPDGKTLASGGQDGAVKLWDTARAMGETSEHVREIPTLETGAVMSLSFSPDGKRLALGTNENSVKVWDVGSRQEVASLLAHTSSVTATAFSPDGKILASGSGGADRTIVLWELAARQPLATLKGCKDRINSVAFSPDGKTLASGSSDASVRLWNVATGREVGTLEGPGGPVSCVAFAPDGNALAAVGKDRVVRLWRAPSFADTDAQQLSARLTPPSR